MKTPRTPVEMLFHWESVSPNRIYLRQPIAGSYVEYDWKRTADEVRRMATALKASGLPAGSHVALASKNCAHWVMADLAIWLAGYVSIPLYPNLSTETAKEILEHSEAKAVFIGKLDKFDDYVRAFPANIPVIAFPYETRPGFLQWDKLVEGNGPDRNATPRSGDEIATIIYTSGTTGKQKGVVHRFRSLGVAAQAVETRQITQDDRFFSYLPLAHVAERLLTELVALYGGSSVSFVESLDLFGKNLAEVRPTVFLGVPRIWEKFRIGILAKVPAEKLNRLLRLPIVSSLVKRKICRGLGLDQGRICITGAAATSPELMHWFQRIGIAIQEGYGLTENLAYSHMNPPGKERIGSVGEPWPNVKVRIAENDEIQVHSPATMVGYYKDPALTAEALDGEWLRTGDQGKVSTDGFLHITGRVKENFKTAKGKYVAPAPIELRLAQDPILEHACVIGSNLTAAMGIVTLSDIGKKLEKSVLVASLRSHLATINAGLDPHERLSRLWVVKENWTVENEYLTPTMKLRRKRVEAKYGAKAAELDESRGEDVVFE